MGTCNFDSQDNFDLWVIDTSDLEEWDIDYISENFNHYNKETNLKYHNLVLKSGYYSGLQIFVNELYENPINLTNEDCKYYYDKTRSQAIREYLLEVKRINKKILPIFKDIGFVKINCIGVFSNGAAIYEYAK